jgi:hypothetical protein
MRDVAVCEGVWVLSFTHPHPPTFLFVDPDSRQHLSDLTLMDDRSTVSALQVASLTMDGYDQELIAGTDAVRWERGKEND